MYTPVGELNGSLYFVQIKCSVPIYPAGLTRNNMTRLISLVSRMENWVTVRQFIILYPKLNSVQINILFAKLDHKLDL